MLIILLFSVFAPLPGACKSQTTTLTRLSKAIVQPTDASGEAEKQVILTIQPRPAVSSLAFTEIPAGMLDDSGCFTGTAAKELKEEAHLEVNQNDLLDLSELALSQEQSNDLLATDQLRAAMYPSPGKTPLCLSH